MFRRVAQRVYEQTGGRQRPELSISLLQDFYLNLRDDDSRWWRRIETSTSEDDLRTFMSRFPSSPFVRDAQTRLSLLVSIRREREDIAAKVAAIDLERRRHAAS